MSGANTLLPWVGCLVLSIVGGIGWSQAFEYQVQAKSAEQKIEDSSQIQKSSKKKSKMEFASDNSPQKTVNECLYL